MPTTIPYSPSLVLGNIADIDKITILEEVSALQAPIDADQDALNILIETKRSLDQTLQEMINMGASSKDLEPLQKSIEKAKTDMAKSAAKYASTVTTQMPKISAQKAKLGGVIEAHVESPMDWNKSDLKAMNIAADSFNVNAQYIRNESEKDNTSAHASSLAVAASAHLSMVFGPTIGAETSSAVNAAALAQTTQHKIEGTILITAAATHKSANMFAPFILDPDKAIRAWNSLVKNKKAGKGASLIETNDEKSLESALKDQDTIGMQLISGATFGSSFVGMVHLLKVETSDSSQSSGSAATKSNVDFEIGGWFAKKSGKFGVDANWSNSVKEMLSRSDIQTHCSLVTMGIIPSLKSNNIKTTVKTLAPDPKEVMSQLGAIQGATDSSVNNMSAGASSARSGAEFMSLNSNYLTSVVSSLGEIDDNNNKVIDMNSLMTAFDDYVTRANDSIQGVPINYYLKPITPAQLAAAWMTKYSPIKYWEMSSGDDSTDSKDGNAGNG